MTTERPNSEGTLQPRLDDIDRAILEALRQDARRPIKEIAELVNLSSAPTKRRIDRLERAGVIIGYTVRVDEALMGSSLEAFTELRYAGDMDQESILAILTNIAEVEDAYAMAGDTDALVHIRAKDISHLQRVISELRARGNPVATRTLIVIKARAGRGQSARRSR